MRKTTILLRTYLSIRAQLKFGFGSYREFLLEEHKRKQNVLTPLGSLEPAFRALKGARSAPYNGIAAHDSCE